MNGELEMIANIPSNIEAQYTTESDALMAAFWAVKHAAKITYAEWRGQEKVRAAEYGVMRMTKCTAPGHQRKLMKLFDSADLVTLRKFHGDHPAVLAAIKAAHKRAGITQKDLAGYERMQRVDQSDDTAPAPHGDILREMFGEASYAGARRAFKAKWDGYFEGPYANAA
jgi:hypothetical protein